MNRNKIVSVTRKVMQRYYDEMPAGKADISHYCLFHAGIMTAVLHRAGIKACLNAGTACWQRIKPEEDDGIVKPDYGYWWKWDADAIAAIAQGRLPEMHVWTVIPESSEIIDLTTCFWKPRSEKDGFPWTAPVPPDYLWCKIKDLPDQSQYLVDRRATIIAHQMLDVAINGGPLVINLGLGG